MPFNPLAKVKIPRLIFVILVFFVFVLFDCFFQFSSTTFPKQISFINFKREPV